MSTTETTVLNPDHSEQSPALQNNNYPTPTTDGHSVESGSTSSVRSRTNKRYVNWIPFGIFGISASVCSTDKYRPKKMVFLNEIVQNKIEEADNNLFKDCFEMKVTYS